MLLRLLLALPLMYLPNALGFGSASLVPGLNLSNLLLLVLLVAVPLFAPANAPRLAGPGRLTPALMIFFLAMIVAFFVAQARAPGNVMDDVTELKSAIFYPLFYFIYRNCRLDLSGTRQLIVLCLVVAAVAAIDAIREGVAANAFLAYSEQQRSSGPFGVDARAANLAGYFYAMFLPIFVAGVLFLRERKLLRIGAIVGCALLGLAIMATFSRQAYAVALVCLLLIALRRSLVVAGLVALLMVVGVAFLPPSVTQRVEQTSQVTQAGTAELDTSTASRFDLWQGAWKMWREHPAGVGLARFKSQIGNYSRYQDFDAHNYYVLVLAEAGLLGLGALIFLVWRLWTVGRNLHLVAVRLDPEARAVATGFSLLVIAMALGNTFGSLFVQGLAMGSFWAFCGLVERYGSLRAAELEEPAAVVQPRDFASYYPLAAKAGLAPQVGGGARAR